MKKVLILGGANGGFNLGDDAMFEALVLNLRKHLGTNQLQIITDAENDWKSPLADHTIPQINKVWNIKKIGRGSLLLRNTIAGIASRAYKSLGIRTLDTVLNKYITAIKDIDLIIFAGMGAMNDKFKYHGIIGRSIIMKIAKVFHKRVIFSGNGIGPVNKRHNKYVCKNFLEHVERIYVRDRINSRKELIKMSYPDDQIIDAVDDSFFLEYNDDDRNYAEKLLKENNIKPKGFIAISMHNWDKDLNKILFNSIGHAINEFKDYHILLIPHYFTGKMDDRLILEKLKEYLNSSGIPNVTLIIDKITASQSKAILRLARFSIATRYHVGVFSLSVGTPTILLSTDSGYYGQKMSGILEWYGLQEYCIKPGAFHTLQSKTRELMKKYPEIIDDINSSNKNFEKQGFKSAEYIVQILGDNT